MSIQSSGPSFGVPAVYLDRFAGAGSTSSTLSSSSDSYLSGSDPSFAAAGASLWSIGGAVPAAPRVPPLPVLTPALPLCHGTIADVHNLQLAAQLLLEPIRGPPRPEPPSAADLLGLGPATPAVSSTATVWQDKPAVTPAAPQVHADGPDNSQQAPMPRKQPAVNGWLRQHPIFGSLLGGSEPSDGVQEPAAEEVPPSAPTDRTEVVEESHAGQEKPGESAELLSLVRQLMEDSRRREEVQENLATRHAAELERDRTAVAAAAEASAAAAAEARDAAERCLAAMERDEARRQAAEAAAAAAVEAASAKLKEEKEAALTAAADEQRLRDQALEAHRRQVALAAVSRWSVMEGSNLANCCFQAWRSAAAEIISERKAQALCSAPTVSVQTDAVEEPDVSPPVDCSAVEDTPLSFVAAGAPPVVPGGCLKALSGEQVWLDMESGAITGAALWLSQKPPLATRNFIRTFDICLPWSECRVRGNSTASSATTLDPSTLEEPVMAPPGSFVRSEPLSASSSPIRSRPTSPLRLSRGTSPINASRLGSRSPSRSPSRSLVRSPVARTNSMIIEPHADADEVTASQVLERIAGLVSEMSAMEASLGNLREELHAEASGDEERAGESPFFPQASLSRSTELPKQAPQRLRHRLSHSLTSAEAPARRSAKVASTPIRRSSSAAAAARVNAMSRSKAQRGRPPFQASLATSIRI